MSLLDPFRKALERLEELARAAGLVHALSIKLEAQVIHRAAEADGPEGGPRHEDVKEIARRFGLSSDFVCRNREALGGFRAARTAVVPGLTVVTPIINQILRIR